MRFHIADPYPGVSLSDIAALPVRARAWASRVGARIPDNESVQTIGVISILEGLEYHFSRFNELMMSLAPYFDRVQGITWLDGGSRTTPIAPLLMPTPTETLLFNGLDHEAIAYLNRLGQFYYFGKARGLLALIPKTSELMAFRRKHTAHRSIDLPQGETQEELEFQAMAFGFYRLTRGGVPTYQLVADKKRREFQLQRDHPVVMAEAASALFSLYPP